MAPGTPLPWSRCRQRAIRRGRRPSSERWTKARSPHRRRRGTRRRRPPPRLLRPRPLSPPQAGPSSLLGFPHGAGGYPCPAMAKPVEEQLKGLPTKSGVYLFRGSRGEVLYVGKAKSLRPRVRSYFQAGTGGRSTIAKLPERVADIEVIVTDTEVEALHLEQNLVKRHRPPFNVRLRDDKSFPYIAVTVEDDYPRVMFTRERHRRGVVYFGPYANAKKVRETLDVLNRVFPYRPCEGPKPGRHSGIPCLDYHIERCLAPCVGYVSKDEYHRIIDGVIEFLSGETRPILRELERKMKDAAEGERFEEAARYRNRLFSVRHLAERQAADKRAVGTVDVIGIAAEGDRAAVQVFPCATGADRPLRVPPRERGRAGHAHAARGVRDRVLRRGAERPAADRRPARIGRHERLEQFLSDRRGSRVEVRAPVRGEKRRLQELATENAQVALQSDAAQAEQRATEAGGGPRGAARGAEPGEPAPADRVLRHLEHPGRGGRGLDGRLPGRAGQEGALPKVRRARARRAGRLRGSGRGRVAAVRPHERHDRLGGLRRVVRRERRTSS